jgi:hypothetical protein
LLSGHSLAGASAATLEHHVTHVVGMRSKEQVVDVDARRVIAAMEHMQAFTDFADLLYPRLAMRQKTAPTKRDAPVTARVPCATKLDAFADDRSIRDLPRLRDECRHC